MLAAGLRDFSVFYQDLPSGPKAPDPKDSHLLALAEASTAEFLVTGDKELLRPIYDRTVRSLRRAEQDAIAALKLAALRDPRNADIQNYIGYAYRRLRQLGPAMHWQSRRSC